MAKRSATSSSAGLARSLFGSFASSGEQQSPRHSQGAALVIAQFRHSRRPSAVGRRCATRQRKPCTRCSLANNEKSLAKGQKRQDRTEWHRIVTWDRTAAACVQHLDVGCQVLVRGRFRTDEL